MESVYLETTIPSYLAAWTSRDLVMAGQQRTTQEWWATAATRFTLYVSEAVIRELSRGDPAAAARRLDVVKGLPLLDMSPEVEELVDEYKRALEIPPKAHGDLLHIAFAVAYEVDYLLTWNCAHIANSRTMRRLYELNRRLGLYNTVVLTPAEMEVAD